ncbi:NUDIX domain-containing protein [Amnibacterium sp.]|uniref:NUDIX hydrolase n=1 Tax=Amnibacterium sp. TaxID=1872496 RepID=UPI0026141146|nr:NUDIX domain-containing protein [Amnibacterium sp.]MCU1474361.1 putative hydrolase [Amnibacterium sp.]
MPTPDFVLRLRERVGHEPLWLVGTTAVVADGDRLLLVRRADSGDWSPVAGIVEPGEHTADAAEREVLEEASVVAVVERLAAVSVTQEYEYPNGDRTRYTDLTYRLRYVSGEAAVGDDESTEVAWFPRDALPPMPERYLRRIRHALEDRADAVIDRRAEP